MLQNKYLSTEFSSCTFSIMSIKRNYPIIDSSHQKQMFNLTVIFFLWIILWTKKYLPLQRECKIGANYE